MNAKDRFTVVGTPRRRVDGRAKVTGRTVFADDIELPRMLHCKLLRSPHPHAWIRGIDTSQAEAAPGVHLVLQLAPAQGQLFSLALTFLSFQFLVTLGCPALPFQAYSHYSNQLR